MKETPDDQIVEEKTRSRRFVTSHAFYGEPSERWNRPRDGRHTMRESCVSCSSTLWWWMRWTENVPTSKPVTKEKSHLCHHDTVDAATAQPDRSSRWFVCYSSCHVHFDFQPGMTISSSPFAPIDVSVRPYRMHIHNRCSFHFQLFRRKWTDQHSSANKRNAILLRFLQRKQKLALFCFEYSMATVRQSGSHPACVCVCVYAVPTKVKQTSESS